MSESRLQLVKTLDFGIKGVNYYWTRRDRYNLSQDELQAVGISDEHAYVDQAIIEPLQKANEFFHSRGYELMVKDAYRPPELYKLVQAKRYALYGKVETDKLLNVETMPHSTGRTVDVSLLDLQTGEEVKMRDSAHDADGGYTIDYYKDKDDPESSEFQRLQELLRQGMLLAGFQLGVKREIWHFEYPNK